MMNRIVTLLMSCVFCSCSQNANKNHDVVATTPTPFDQPPTWAKEVVWYEIGIDRFRNGDPSNDPTASDIEGAYPGFVPQGWQPSRWTKDWYADDPYIANLSGEKDFYGNTLEHFTQKAQLRRYGGDLQGVLDQMDYLVELGISAIYFRPLNDSPSLHKYDARNWRHIDRNLGPDPKKDQVAIDSETPDDPKTWVWTEADLLFLKVIRELHAKGIRVIMDYSWNHTGQTFWAWQDILENQENSNYKDWYWIESFDDPSTKENEFKYHGWAGVYDLPEIKETQKQDLSERVRPFEGNIYSEAVRRHIYQVAHRWLDPNQDGDPSDGIDGFRLDVAAETPLGFWRDFRRHVRGINPEAYLVGEIWWEKWPDELLDPEPYLRGDIFDAVMNYRWYKAARHFLNSAPDEIYTSELIDSLNSFRANTRNQNDYAMMNLTGSFDTPRVLTSLFNQNKYKYLCRPGDDPAYKIHRPDSETLQTLELLLLHQYSYVGAPHIWAGDEMGMWGDDDPSTRKPLIWEDLSFEEEKVHPLGHPRIPDQVRFNRNLFETYQRLISLRKHQLLLTTGKLAFIDLSHPKVLAYSRFDDEGEIIVVLNSDFDEASLQVPISKEGTYTDLYHKGVYQSASGRLNLKVMPRTGSILLRSSPQR